MRKRRSSFVYILPVLELTLSAAAVLAPAMLIFFRLKRMAHGAGSVSLSSSDFTFTIPSDGFLSAAFSYATFWADEKVTILNTPAKFLETLVSLLVAHKGYWTPSSLLTSTWRTLVYPIYALPAWAYVGFGIDAAMGRRLVRRWNWLLSAFLSLSFAALFCGFRFGMPAAEREGQELLSWFIQGFALWSVLFAIPFLAWVLRRKREIVPVGR